jgi:hypothetical protein
VTLLDLLGATVFQTLFDVAPIVAVLVGFQALLLRRRPPHLGRLVVGALYVLAGLTLFLVGLEQALFPLGRLMAEQLTAPAFTGAIDARLGDYFWVYAFAAAIGFATTIAEPSLIAVAIKANEVSGGTIGVRGLRLAVAVGVAAGVSLGTVRIVSGAPLHYFLIVGYLVVILQTLTTSRAIVPLAYDSGGVTTSTVTVPLVTALGLGLASSIPGRGAAVDGFGLIAFASLFPMITVMGYAQLGEWRRRRGRAERRV